VERAGRRAVHTCFSLARVVPLVPPSYPLEGSRLKALKALKEGSCPNYVIPVRSAEE
jgi:hypothetical protein